MKPEEPREQGGPRPKKRRWVVALLALAFMLVGVVVLRSIQRAILFPRHMTQPMEQVASRVPGLSRWWIDSPEGRVEAWFIPGEGRSAASPGPAAIFTHGNGELIDHWPLDMAAYRRMGVSLLLAEYRGYGRSAGSPSEEAIREDMLAFHERLIRAPEVDPSRLVYHGRSLGGGAACALARERPPAALILESTFTSVADVAWETMRVPSLLIADRFDNHEVLRAFPGPVLLMHGRVDQVIPFAHAERNARAAARATLVPYDAGHNDLRPHAPDFWARVEAHLREAEVL